MTKLHSELEWLEDLAEKAADELEEHLETIKEHFISLKDRPCPYSSSALFSFIPKIESIRLGMFEVAKVEDHYSFRILKRSMIEHELKFRYLWMRHIEEKSDDVGKEYFIFCKAKEDLDYIKALRDSAEMLGIAQRRSPIEVLNELQPMLKNISNSKLKQMSEKFTYKNVTKYLHQRINMSLSKDVPFFYSLIPAYSELSSFVHGGPDSLSYSTELRNPEILETRMIEDLALAQMISFSARASAFLVFYQENKKMAEPFNIMSRYVKEIAGRNVA